MQTFCRRVLTARRSEMLLMIALDVLVPRIAAEATRQPRMGSFMPTSPGLDGRWLGMVVSNTLAGYVSNESDVNVR